MRNMSDLMASLVHLSPAEKLELIGELWDDLSARTENVSLTEAQKEDLDRRKAEFEANPDSGMTWEEVKRRITSRNAQ